MDTSIIKEEHEQIMFTSIKDASITHFMFHKYLKFMSEQVFKNTEILAVSYMNQINFYCQCY
jgi:hypothetical protein